MTTGPEEKNVSIRRSFLDVDVDVFSLGQDPTVIAKVGTRPEFRFEARAVPVNTGFELSRE